MKRTANLLSILTAASIAAVTIGCSTVSVQSTQYVAAPSYPPTDPASIQILQMPPAVPNVRLGEVRLQPSGNPSKEMIRTKLQNAAAAMGANAAVIVADRQQVLGAYVSGPWWGRQVTTETGRVIIAVAIRYIQ